MFLHYVPFSVPVLPFVLPLLMKLDLRLVRYLLGCYIFRQFSATIKHNLNKMRNLEIFVLNYCDIQLCCTIINIYLGFPSNCIRVTNLKKF